jgi:SAM-dependent methyltransferase
MTSTNPCETAYVCRICSSEFFKENLNLGLTPIANELYPDYESAVSAEKYPLILRMCSSCRHVQLNHTVSAQRLFNSYVYSSSTSETFRKHFISLANEIKDVSKKNLKVIEVGSNDGFLIDQLASIGFETLGIEPSQALVEKSQSLGLNIIQAYLSDETVKKIQNEFGIADIVIGNNVFAHIDDISEAMSNVNQLLKPNGVFILEVAYLRDLFERNLFDSIYHEHISYHSLYSLNILLSNVGFKIIKVSRISTHGGSIRVWAKKIDKEEAKASTDNAELLDLIDEEISLGLTNPSLLLEMAKKVDQLKSEVDQFIGGLDKNSFNFGYTAPAKLVTFLSQIDLSRLKLRCIVDDNVSKQKMFVAGFGLEIVSSQVIIDRFQDYYQQNKTTSSANCLVFAWNITDEIASKIHEKFTSDLKIITFLGGVKELKWK